MKPKVCQCSQNIVDDPPHAMLNCSFNGIINDWVLGVLINLDEDIVHGDISSINITTLNLELGSETRFSVLWFLATTFSLLWTARQKRKPMNLDMLRSLIGAKIDVLKKTSHRFEANLIDSSINFSPTL